MEVIANNLFGIGFDTTAKTVTDYGIRAKSSFISVYNETTKQYLYRDRTGGVTSDLPGRLILTVESVAGMSNTDTITVEIDVLDAELNAYLTGRLVGRTEKAVTPSATADLPNGPGFVVVRGNAGTVNAITLFGDTVSWAMDAKEVSLVMVRRVLATSTATDIKVIY